MGIMTRRRVKAKALKTPVAVVGTQSEEPVEDPTPDPKKNRKKGN